MTFFELSAQIVSYLKAQPVVKASECERLNAFAIIDNEGAISSANLGFRPEDLKKNLFWVRGLQSVPLGGTNWKGPVLLIERIQSQIQNTISPKNQKITTTLSVAILDSIRDNSAGSGCAGRLPIEIREDSKKLLVEVLQMLYSINRNSFPPGPVEMDYLGNISTKKLTGVRCSINFVEYFENC